jgi:hypothetical protein
MKKTLLLVLLLLCTTFIFAQIDVWKWAKQAGGTGYDYCWGIATDSEGNSYVTGYFSGVATFGSTELTSSGGNDIFVAKLDSNGNWQWAKQAGGDSDNSVYGSSIVIDSDGNSYVTGAFSGSVIFETSPSTTLISDSGSYDIFVARLDSSGNWLWATKAGGTSTDWASNIVIGPSGNSYVTGYFQGIAYFGTSPNIIELSSSGKDDIFVAKLDNSGNWQWATKAGAAGNNSDHGCAIAIDESENIFVTGYFQGTATFITNSIILTSTSNSIDIFVAKLDSSGNWLWAKQAGGTDWDSGNDIAIDTQGNCYITGDFSGRATFGSTSLESSGGADIFVAKLDSSGNWLYAQQAGGSNTNADTGCGIDTDYNGNIYVTGYFYSDDAIFGDITLDTSGNSDIFVAKLGNAEQTTLSIELTSFFASISNQNKVNLNWVSQSETDLIGYYVLRGTDKELSDANVISPLINATNTSQPKAYMYTDTDLNVSGTYHYWLQYSGINGTNGFHGPIKVNYEANTNSSCDIPLVTSLDNVYPNPFNPIAYINYTLESKSEVKFIIYNTRGQIVKTFDLGTQDEGHHRITWDGSDNNGVICSNGIYYLVMHAGKTQCQRKAVLMK